MVSVVIQNSKAKKKRLKKNSPENISIKYTVYILLWLSIVLTFFIPYLYAINVLDYGNSVALSSISFSFMFPLIAFSYMLYKGKRIKTIVDELGISKRRLALRYVGLGILLFILFFSLQLIAGIVEYITGYMINTNVSSTLSNFPIYFYIFAFLIAPINEEILFRGFMVPRFGIIISAIIFGAMHYLSYFSIAEFVAALAFGLAAGYIFKRTKSLYPSIFGHMLFDFVNVLLLLMV